MRFGSTARVLAKRKLQYWKISERVAAPTHVCLKQIAKVYVGLAKQDMAMRME